MHNDQANGQVFYADYQLYRDPLYLLPWGNGSDHLGYGHPGRSAAVER